MVCDLKKLQPKKGIKFAYWSCTNGGCKISWKTKDVDSLDELEFGSTNVHTHDGLTSGDIIRMEMGRVKSRDQKKDLI